VNELNYLSPEDVIGIHEVLCRDFAATASPIAPPGLRSRALLESAVGRQHVGIGPRLKYPDPIANAATLTYGVCNGHAFHNGNKRTALVAMLAHLDQNHLALYQANQRDLYNLMLSIATHTVGLQPREIELGRVPRRRTDDEVTGISAWLRDRVQRFQRGEKPLTYRELRRILADYGYLFGDAKGNTIEICREVETVSGIFRKKATRTKKHVGSIPFPGDNGVVGVALTKEIRRMCGLREQDGVDSASFYAGADMVDTFVNQYRTVLRRLART
jgi:prophage maintenance system killer protein